MKFVQKIGGAIVTGIIAACAFTIVGTTDATYAADKKAASSQEKKAASSKDDKAYTFTANAGDSYTQLVRKAAQIYGINNKVKIGQPRIVSIETKASEAADWPTINEGQVVAFSKSQVKAWVDASLKLSDDEVAAWATYVPYINFDTRHIGE